MVAALLTGRLRALVAGSVLGLFLAACAGQQTTASDSRCPEDSNTFGLSVGPVGVSVGESGLKAAFRSIRDFFNQRPAAGQAEKAQAAERAAEEAAKASAQPMSEEQKRQLRAEASQWVDEYAEKCRAGSR